METESPSEKEMAPATVLVKASEWAPETELPTESTTVSDFHSAWQSLLVPVVPN